LGFILGGKLPKVVPVYLGQFLFWIGVPISIVAFLRGLIYQNQFGLHRWSPG